MYGSIEIVRHQKSKPVQEAALNYYHAGILIVFVILLSIAASGWLPTWKSDSHSVVVQSSPIRIIVERENSNEVSMFPYPFLDNAFLMEPHRKNKVIVSGCAESDLETSCYLSWTLQSDSGIIAMSGSAPAPAFIISPVKTGKYSLVIESEGGNVNSFTIWVKYVRRELQSLTESDRNEFLDALRVLWDVSTVDGQKIYGERYKSLWYFATVHNDAGANRICDGFHASNGFVNNHVILGSYLEQSLQLVNPRVALHYMEYAKYFSSADFTKHLKNQLDGGAWTEILSDKYFGSNDPYTGNLKEVFEVVIFHLP